MFKWIATVLRRDGSNNRSIGGKEYYTVEDYEKFE